MHTVYAGTLDQEFRDDFEPSTAIFTTERPKWAKTRTELQEFEEM